MEAEDTMFGANRAATAASAKARRWRDWLGQLAPLLAGAALLILGALVVDAAGLVRATATPEPSQGAIRAGQPAPYFRLRDQAGAPVTLESLRGKVVVLTFLYSSCPGTCPLTLGKFGYVRDQLGPRAGDAAFLAITVDPKRDEPDWLRQFLATQGLQQEVMLLTGDRADLEQTWREYGITVTRGPGTAGSAGEGYKVIHTDRVYLIDRAGCLRDVLRSSAEPQELLASLARLLGDDPPYGGSTCG